jgi:hypothetical protein
VRIRKNSIIRLRNNVLNGQAIKGRIVISHLERNLRLPLESNNSVMRVELKAVKVVMIHP